MYHIPFSRIAFLLFLKCLGFCIFVETATGTVFPCPSIPASYVGEYYYLDDNSYKMFLYLGETHTFLLREETVLPNKKIAIWETTGKWHQLENGSIIQLANKNSFLRKLNVGGEGNLYLSHQVPTGNYVTITLQQEDIALPYYTIHGILLINNDQKYIKDINTDTQYEIIDSDILQDFLNEQSECTDKNLRKYVQATIYPLYNKSNLEVKIVEIKEEREIDEKWTYQNSDRFFYDSLTDIKWQILFIGVDRKISSGAYLYFSHPKEKQNGKIEFFDGSRYATGTYIVENEKINMSLETDNGNFLSIFNNIIYWEVYGNVLELRDEARILGVLEKVQY